MSGVIYCYYEEARNEVNDEGFNFFFTCDKEVAYNHEIFHEISYSPSTLNGFIHAMVKIDQLLFDEGWDACEEIQQRIWYYFTISSELINLKNLIERIESISPTYPKLKTPPLLPLEDEDNEEDEDDEEPISPSLLDDEEDSDKNICYIYCYIVNDELPFNGEIQEYSHVLGFMNSENHAWDDDCYCRITYYSTSIKDSFSKAMNQLITNYLYSLHSDCINQDNDNWQYQRIDNNPDLHEITDYVKRISRLHYIIVE